RPARAIRRLVGQQSEEMTPSPLSKGRHRSMRKLLIVVLATAAAMVVAGPAAAATKNISIYASGFSPKNVTVTEGDTVTWLNADANPHQVLAPKGQFVPPLLSRGQKHPVTFHAAGTHTSQRELPPQRT